LLLDEVDYEAPKEKTTITEKDSSDEYDTDIEIDGKQPVGRDRVSREVAHRPDSHSHELNSESFSELVTSKSRLRHH
jgi:hypothetical protein